MSLLEFKWANWEIETFESISLTDGFGTRKNTRVYISKKFNGFSSSHFLDILILKLPSSFCSVYPARPGKFIMFSWFVSQESDKLRLDVSNLPLPTEIAFSLIFNPNKKDGNRIC